MGTSRLLLAGVLLASVVDAASLCACGKKSVPAAQGEASKPAAPVIDRSTPEVVLAQAHALLRAGDLAGLSAFLTERGAASVRLDLEAWRAMLVDPAGGPRLASRLPVPDDPAERASLTAALSGGDPTALLRLYLRADPHPPLPPAAPVPRAPDLARVELGYPAADGSTRRVVLVRKPDGWRIDRLAL